MTLRAKPCHVTQSRAWTPIEAIFLPHEAVWILFDRLAYPGVVLQIRLQRRMILYELPVIHERGIFPELFGNYPMVVEEAIETRQFFAISVAILSGPRVLGGSGLCAGRPAEAKPSR